MYNEHDSLTFKHKITLNGLVNWFDYKMSILESNQLTNPYTPPPHEQLTNNSAKQIQSIIGHPVRI